MTDSPSDATTDETAIDETAAAQDPVADLAARIAQRIDALSWTADHGTARIVVSRGRWVESVRTVGEELSFFSWLSAIDWSREVAVGEPAADVDDLDERYDLLCRLSSVQNAEAVILVTSLPKDDPSIESLVPVFGGAAWHEREAAEMFGIDFRGHPNLIHLYLPDAFEGHPLQKSYALLSREVKPWPGTVDVEGMPSTENVEAAANDAAANGDDA